MRDYSKVHSTFWTSSDIRNMSEDGRTLALYLLTCPHGTLTGTFRLPDGYVCDDLQWDAKRVENAFKETLAKGFANRCETTKWVWVNKHLAWNPPENPNQKKSAQKLAEQIPSDCSWKPLFMRVCGELMGLESEPFRNPFETLSQPVTVTGTGTGTGIEESSLSTSLPACPQKDILELFTKLLPDLPQPRFEIWKDGKNGKALASRWKWVLTAKRPNGEPYARTATEAIEWFERFFAYVAKSEFLTGKSSDWRCDLAWLVTASNFEKVLQGNYENKEKA